MAKLTALLIGAALLLAAAAPADAADVLKKGSRGARVAKVQRWLGLNADGIFGKDTKAAVKRWQRRHGLTADGIVGPATWHALQARAPRRARARKQRSSSSAPRSAAAAPTYARSSACSHIPADGVFGPQTARAVKRFQRARGLVADGIVGPATWAALGRAGIARRAQARRAHVPRRPRRAADASCAGSSPPATASPTSRTSTAAATGSGTTRGYDCSGSVSYALHGAGLLSSALTSRRLHVLGLARAGPLGDDLRLPRPRLHGRQRPPLRHDRAQRDRHALAGRRSAPRRATSSATRPACKKPNRGRSAEVPERAREMACR